MSSIQSEDVKYSSARNIH